MKFYIQSGYDGKEIGALAFCYERDQLAYSAREEYKEGMVPVGTVEFVEQYIGVRTPDYSPESLSSFFHRKIWLSESWPKEKCFIKPADRHKRFDAKILKSLKRPVGYGGGIATGIYVGPYWCSEIVDFTDEWRYYVANGKVLAAYWYFGQEAEVDPPELDFAFPSSFCGAVDFGRLDSGEVALVENNLPYACGWYGPYSEGKIYGEWLEEGFRHLNKTKI